MSRIFYHNTLGLKVPVTVPFTTVEEYGRLKQDADAWFDTVCKNECYSNFAPEFGARLVKEIETATGQSCPLDSTKEEKKKKDGTVIPQYVTPRKWINKLISDKVITEDQLAAFGAKVAAGMDALDVTPSESTSQKAPKEYVTTGRALLAGLNENGRDPSDWLEAAKAKYPTVSLVGPAEGEDWTAELAGLNLYRISTFRAAQEAAELANV